jgi:hypothetical protein
VAGHEKDFKEAETIRERFLSAFHSEDELEAAPPAPPPPAKAGNDAPAAPEKADEPVDDATVIGVPIPDDLGKTAAIPVQPKTDDAPPADGTMILQWPKLLVHRDDGRAEEHAVVGTGTVIGSGADCDLVLTGKKIADTHAEIALGPNGHIIRDLGSPVGTLVNGVEVTERELANGDTIQIGEIKLTFTV